jgi:hypothetical protein
MCAAEQPDHSINGTPQKASCGGSQLLWREWTADISPYNENIICMRFTMDTTTSRNTLTTSPLLTPEERLKLWQRFKGMWKSRTPDPVEELEKMRKEWDRELPLAR